MPPGKAKRPPPRERAPDAAPPRASSRKSPARRDRRCYGQFCGLAKALDAVGERWTLLLVRDLMLGPKRFGDLQRGLDGLAPNLLAARLKEMEAAGLIGKVDAPGGRSPAYALAQAGRELEPALHALGQWGFRFLSRPDPRDRKELAWGLFALKRRYRGTEGTRVAEIRCEGRRFQFRLDGPRVELREGGEDLPDVLLEAEGDAFRALFFRGESAAGLKRAGRLAFGGSPADLDAFLDAFGLKP